MGVHEIAELLGTTVYGHLENYYIPCPLAPWRHPSGQNPGSSFSIKEIRATDAIGYCWSCGWTGNMGQLAAEFDRLGDWRGDKLRSLVGRSLSCEELHAILDKEERDMAKAAKKAKVELPQEYRPIAEGQWDRCPLDVQQRYGVMWDDRLGPVCVVREHDGTVAGWQHRNLHHDPTDKKSAKYLNNDGFRRGMHLYGLHTAQDRKVVVVSEGASDAHAIAEARPELCSVSTLGAAIGPTHLKKLALLFSHIIIAFDNDSAGMKGLDKALLLLANYPQFESVRVMTYSGLAAKDPDALDRETLGFFLDSAVPVEYTSDTGEADDADLIPDELEDDESSFDGDTVDHDTTI